MRSNRGHAPARRFAALCCLCALIAAGALAQPVPEQDLKAAFIFNFAVFTEWPQEALAGGAPITVCAGPTTSMFGALSQLNDKQVNGHRIAVRSAAVLRGCHVLVLDRSDRERWVQIRRELAGAPVLTVSDDPGLSDGGAVITLTVEDKRIGFHVDLAAARSARLSLSSKLLRLARNVQ